MATSASNIAQLEFIVTAKNSAEAKDKLAEVGIDEKTRTTRRNVQGFYMATSDLDVNLLTDEFYDTIKKHKDISILTDSASWERNQEILNEIYKVETELRKLLLHIFDLVEAFYELFSKTQYAKTFANHKSVTYKDHLDPLTSRLMLGEMIAILRFDLSWQSKQLSPKHMLELLEGVTNLEEFRASIEKKLKPNIPWEIISEHVLAKPLKWSTIEPLLDEIKDYRNKAAHFQIVTETQKTQVIETARNLHEKITKRKPSSDISKQAVDALTKGYTSQLNSLLTAQQKLAASTQLNRAFLDIAKLNQSESLASVFSKLRGDNTTTIQQAFESARLQSGSILSVYAQLAEQQRQDVIRELGVQEDEQDHASEDSDTKPKAE